MQRQINQTGWLYPLSTLTKSLPTRGFERPVPCTKEETCHARSVVGKDFRLDTLMGAPLTSSIDPIDQFSRFNSSYNLVDYVCGTATDTDYDPVCPFPYINAGWGSVVGYHKTNFEDASSVTLGTCSITYASSLDVWGFVYERAVYMSISVGCTLGASYLFVQLRRHRHERRSASRSSIERRYLGSLTLAEKLCLLNCLASAAHAVAWVDFWGYSATLPFQLVSFLKALTASTLISIPAVRS